MTNPRKKQIFLKRLESLYQTKVEPKFKNGVKEIENLLKKEIRFGKLKKASLFEYDPNSPFSYLSAFLRDSAVASVAPSTKYVVNRVIKAIAPEHCKTIVEFGPAEGVMSRKLLEKLPDDSSLIAIERNDNFVKTLKKIDNKKLHVVHGDVKDVDAIVHKEGFKEIDVIVSGIPFSFFELQERHRLIKKIRSLLPPKGKFVAYQFTTHLIPLLKQYFRKVGTQFEIRNLPPFFIFTAFK